MPARRPNTQSDLKTQVAARVRALRHAQGWSQEVLAELSGLHRNYVGHVERAELTPGLINLAALARAFELSLSDFLDGV